MVYGCMDVVSTSSPIKNIEGRYLRERATLLAQNQNKEGENGCWCGSQRYLLKGDLHFVLHNLLYFADVLQYICHFYNY